MSREAIHLSVLTLGEWGTNCHVLISAGQSVIIDPAAEADSILAAVEGTAVQSILLTHAHGDHVQALDEVRQATGAPLALHPADAAEFGIQGDSELYDGDVIRVGEGELTVIHTPGHTPGSVCFRFDRRAVVIPLPEAAAVRAGIEVAVLFLPGMADEPAQGPFSPVGVRLLGEVELVQHALR